MDTFNWDVSPTKAVEAQQFLRQRLKIQPLNKEVKTVAGADVSLNRFEKDLYAGIIVFSYPDLTPLTHSLVKIETNFPYIPGLLSFREAPGLLQAWEKLEVKPDLLVVDGQGIAHPRRLGIAAHIGVMLDVPTIGVAKSILYGKHRELGDQAHSEQDLIDPKTGEPLGIVLRTKERSKPVIISPGHKISLEESGTIIKSMVRGYRIPEPTRLAHNLVNQFRRGEIS